LPAELEPLEPHYAEQRIRSGELKYVTLLRSDLVRSTDLVAGLGPEEAMMRLEPALVAMRAAVRKFRGVVCREMGDGILAVFGAPVAFDTHAQLALHAAFEVLRQIDRLADPQIQVRLGVHSGAVVAYLSAGEYSTSFDLGGNALHLVDRIQGAAEPGQIFVSEACQALNEGFADFERLPPRSLKGYAEPVPLYRATGIGDPSRWQVRAARSVSPFVGRETELACLRDAAAQALSGAGRAVLVVGEPGIGKSRLMHEFTREMAAEQRSVLRAECSPIQQAAPYSALKTVMRTMLDADSGTALHGLLGVALDVVLDRPVQDAAWARLEPKARGRWMAEACTAVLVRVAQGGPAVLLIEDAHWMDGASAQLLDGLAARWLEQGRLLVATARPENLPPWAARPDCERIQLQPLDDEAAARMLDALVPRASAPDDLWTRLLQHTGSIPLFIEEVCHQLSDGQVLAEASASIGLGIQFDELRVPPTVQGVIASRIDRLDVGQRRLLQVASAIGPRCSARQLSAITLLPEEALQHQLQLLDAAALLVHDFSVSAPGLRFTHDLVRQVAYESMLDSTREPLHGRILAALEAEAEQAADDRSDVMCHHAMLGKRWDKAFDYARHIARKCVARSALQEATRHIDIAMAALDRLPLSAQRERDAADIRIESRNAYSGSGQVERWLELARQAEARARAIADGPREVAAMAVRAAALNFYGTPLQAAAEGEVVLREARQLGDSGWLSFAEYGLGQAHFIAGRCRDAERLLGMALDRLAGPGGKAASGTSLDSMIVLVAAMKAAAHVGLGELDLAEACEQRAREGAARTERPFDAVAVGYSQGLRLIAQGRAASARQGLQQTLSQAEQNEIRLFSPVLRCQLGIAELEGARSAEALQCLQLARDEAEAIGHTSVALRSAAMLAWAYGMAGERLQALRLSRSTRSAARRMGFEGIEAEALLAEVQVLLHTPQRLRGSIAKRLAVCEAMAWRLQAPRLLTRTQALRGQFESSADADLQRGTLCESEPCPT
jgi:class 3 adenylate cyclase